MHLIAIICVTDELDEVRFMELSRVVETFREFGLHQLNDPNASLDYAGTARILARIYSQLSGPTTDVQTKSCSKTTPSFDPNVLRAASEILLSFLIYALDVCATARLTVNSLKIALSTLTNAKPSDKFRCRLSCLHSKVTHN
ncbi:hypothetical protein X801_00338 [Opisthorchis viverrini]|uniref:Uncharacterized protein n=1 Tax=Opisthorchis viverrini TaxID=6198 RepID=A0A1S8XAJ9_OPIVI|nr:hypothetical protein X801_00338 [Opisthorchis viverrini]